MIMGSKFFPFFLACIAWFGWQFPGQQGGDSDLSSPPLPPLYLHSRHKGLERGCMETSLEHFSRLQVTFKYCLFVIIFFWSKTSPGALQKILQKSQARVRNTKHTLHLYCKNVEGGACNTFKVFATCSRPGYFYLLSYPCNTCPEREVILL